MPKITFQPMNVTVEVADGETVLDAAHRHGIPLEGACEGSLACSTCHVVIDPAWYRKLEPASEDEEDILDRAFGVTPSSRLACQVTLGAEHDGLVLTIPEYSVNISVDKKGKRPT